MANNSYKNPSMKQLDILKTENEIERSHYPILLQAQKAWENIEHFRQKRKRNRDYTYGKQWNDLIKLPDGRVVSEEQYIREQGKVPLKNNLIRQMVKAVLGQFRNNQTQPHRRTTRHVYRRSNIEIFFRVKGSCHTIT